MKRSFKESFKIVWSRWRAKFTRKKITLLIIEFTIDILIILALVFIGRHVIGLTKDHTVLFALLIFLMNRKK